MNYLNCGEFNLKKKFKAELSFWEEGNKIPQSLSLCKPGDKVYLERGHSICGCRFGYCQTHILEGLYTVSLVTGEASKICPGSLGSILRMLGSVGKLGEALAR